MRCSSFASHVGSGHYTKEAIQELVEFGAALQLLFGHPIVTTNDVIHRSLHLG